MASLATDRTEVTSCASERGFVDPTGIKRRPSAD
jgi:hypothetical protein